MTPEETRDSVVDALRRDLLGPLADTEGHYPGATPVTISPGQNLETKELSNLFVATDRHEVLVAESPTGRYITGAIYPLMSAGEEIELDRDQAPDTGEIDTADDTVPEPPKPLSEPRAPEAIADAELDAETTIVDRPGRPSSLGVSFVIDAHLGQVDVEVTGARYENFDVLVASKSRPAWHRVPLSLTVSVGLPPANEARAQIRTVGAGPMSLEIGVHARAGIGGNRIVTCYLVNRTAASDLPLAARVLFSAQIAVPLPEGSLSDYPQQEVDQSDEARTLRLLYAGMPVRAVGHGVDAVVEDTPTGPLVRTESMPVAHIAPTTPDIPGLSVGMTALGDWDSDAIAAIDRMIDGYRAWISNQRSTVSNLSLNEQEVANLHLGKCDAFVKDISAGWALAQTGTVMTALRWTSAAMADQRLAYAARTRKVNGIDFSTGHYIVDPSERATKSPEWRPFQLAFILANLAPTIDPSDLRRRAVDVIWMPTGGGKTEAYLGLAAFTMLHRRLLDSRAAGTTVLMRYTLRLLTAQQLQRAASLICALESLRNVHPELGSTRFTIGAWLGQASTPNWRKDALKQLNDMTRPRASHRRPFLLSRCPACATEMGRVLGGKVLGYDPAPAPGGDRDRMRASCPNPGCNFHLTKEAKGLPVFEVDEDIYEVKPTFVVATVDKFAQLAWKSTPRSLFGINLNGRRSCPAPELFIQDELHLISGPLGSLVGLYESAIDQLCRHDGGQAPRIVAATATTRAYGRQAAALYDCAAQDVRLLPPPGVRVDDSYFAHADADLAPRVHVAICATGVARFQHSEMRVLASLAHAAAAIEQAEPEANIDPYWTNVVFFGSLRDLGQAKALLATDARSYAWRLRRSTGVSSGLLRPDGTRAAVRARSDVELTSASSGEATQALERLAKGKNERGCVDLALATSVIEVGVDVERLGLLTIIRQPKTAAQYIQVSGRVGRNARTGPGLVVSVLNPLNSRDMSHYERFTSTHDRLYASVESASVTPFTGAALTRALRGALAATVRQTRPDNDSRITADDLSRLAEATAEIRARVGRIAPSSVATFDDLSSKALKEAEQAAHQQLDWGGSRTAAFLRPPENIGRIDQPSWFTLTSLRSVDVDAAAHVDSAWLPGNRARTASVDGDSSEEEPW